MAAIDRVQIVHEMLRSRLLAGDMPDIMPPTSALQPYNAVALLRAQCVSRALDIESRAMQRHGYGYYTIGSSGHEGMAAVAQALRPDDIAFLHYRDAAFQIARAGQINDQIYDQKFDPPYDGRDDLIGNRNNDRINDTGRGQNPIWDMLLSFACSSEDPISGGRHKVLGSKALMIPPQTSTIASHLPKAVGMAYSIGITRQQNRDICRPEHQLVPASAIAICSFGDASLNHSTAQGAINTAAWTAFKSIRLPLLFICEDNGIGISTKTPEGWIAATMAGRPAIKYFYADGLDIFDTFNAASMAAAYVRKTGRPAFLHLRMVRLYGHAGSDVAMGYLSTVEIEEAEAQDPLIRTAGLLDKGGILTARDALEIYDQTVTRITLLAQKVKNRPTLHTASDVSASLIPPERVCADRPIADREKRARVFGQDLEAMAKPQPMSRHLNWALTDVMLQHPEIRLMGEDIGKKGGVYGITQKLQNRFGPGRVIDTVLDEQSILGLAIGMAQNGFIPIPEIQFLAYLHNAEDQLRGEAATLSFFSNGQFTNPMVIRIAGLGYQKGFGGHFHNDNSIAVLRDIPGLIIACPSSGPDAAKMLREAIRLAREAQRIVVFLEPIALYNIRDLEEEGDAGWLAPYSAPHERIALGKPGIHGSGTDLAILTYGNGVYLSRKAQSQLTADGIATRLIDIRWLAPLPLDALLSHTQDCQAILIVDECRQTGSLSEGLMVQLVEAGRHNIARLAAKDSFIATGPAYAAPLPAVADICARARDLVKR